MADTLPSLFLETVRKYDKKRQFLYKEGEAWHPVSAREALQDIEQIALGLRALGVRPGDRVGVLSENRYEWPIVDLAILGLGAVTVPLYPTQTAEQCAYILSNCQARIVIVSDEEQLKKIHIARRDLPELDFQVYIDSVANAHPTDRSLASVLEWGSNQLETQPNAYRDAVGDIEPDDLATIIYTSGTTGEPKGAMLTHDNIVSNVKSSFQVIQVGPHDTSLSFLPLCHIFERMAGLYGMLYGGVTIAYAESIEKVADNVAEVRPTVLTGVPRFYEKVYARILEVASEAPAPRRKLFEWGLRQGIARAQARFAGRGLSGLAAIKTLIADVLVGRKIRSRMGGRLRFAVSGGAPLNPKVLEFFYAIGIPVVEGYGLTETSPVICVAPLDRVKPGSVGPAIPGVEMKLGEHDEILTRGPHVMQGYFENEEATKAAFVDGWFRTGDVGRIDEDGYLFITDRLKQLLVTAGGKKVAPQPIEAKLKEDPLVAEAMLIGDRMPFIACLFFPNFVELERMASRRGWEVSTRAELVAHPEVRRYFQELIEEINQPLARYEQIKQFAVLEGDLSLETGELTPTLKLRRKIVHERFEPFIHEIYRGHETPGIEMDAPEPESPGAVESGSGGS